MTSELPDSETASNPTASPPILGAQEPTVIRPMEPVGFTFTGTAEEYFKIWIVNLLLSVVTCGIYIPWALVRSRRYFHANTRLDGHAFDYLAQPKNLLIGYLIVLSGFAMYMLAGIFNPILVFPVLIIFGSLSPWLFYKAFRFRARNTAYRNVRFKFNGDVGGAYAVFLGYAMLTGLTLGIITPLWEMHKKEYLFKNLHFGTTSSTFSPKPGMYFKYYYGFGALAIVLYFGAMFLLVGISTAVSMTMAATSAFTLIPMLMMAFFYLIFLCIVVFVQRGIWLKVFNYNLDVWTLGELRFKSRMKLLPFIGVVLSNILACIVSLGLLVPWARIRLIRYKLDNVVVLAPNGDIGSHFEAVSTGESAIGDTAVEFMDIDIGL